LPQNFSNQKTAEFPAVLKLFYLHAEFFDLRGQKDQAGDERKNNKSAGLIIFTGIRYCSLRIFGTRVFLL